MSNQYDAFMVINTGTEDAVVEEIGTCPGGVAEIFAHALTVANDGKLFMITQLNGKRGGELVELIERAISDVHRNWWVYDTIRVHGDVVHGRDVAFRYLRSIRDACEQHPEARLQIR